MEWNTSKNTPIPKERRTLKTFLNTRTPLIHRSRSELTMSLSGNLFENELTRNLSGNSQPQSSQLAEPLWTDPGIKSAELVIERLHVRTPVLPQWPEIDTGHSANSEGGRLHTHTPYTQRWSELTMPLSRHSVGIYPKTSSHATCQGTLTHSRLSLLSHFRLIVA